MIDGYLRILFGRKVLVTLSQCNADHHAYRHSAGLPSLIFCNAKKDAENVAKALADGRDWSQGAQGGRSIQVSQPPLAHLQYVSVALYSDRLREVHVLASVILDRSYIPRPSSMHLTTFKHASDDVCAHRG